MRTEEERRHPNAKVWHTFSSSIAIVSPYQIFNIYTNISIWGWKSLGVDIWICEYNGYICLYYSFTISPFPIYSFPCQTISLLLLYFSSDPYHVNHITNLPKICSPKMVFANIFHWTFNDDCFIFVHLFSTDVSPVGKNFIS